MTLEEIVGGVLIGAAATTYLGGKKFSRYLRRRRYERGEKLTKEDRTRPLWDSLLFGNTYLPTHLATQHFLFAGTTGSGKTLLQRRLLQKPLLEILPKSDKRALIFDAKGDTAAFLNQIGVTCPVYSLNPFHSAGGNVVPVAWDVAKDVTSPARAMNLAASLLPQEKASANRYFTDAARQVLSGVIESFIRHSGAAWSFSDLVYAMLSQERIKEILCRDEDGRDVLKGFFGDERTAYQVFTTIASRIGYYRPVAALWQRSEKKVSARDWLESSSILLLGANATAKTTLEAVNEIFFRCVVEEVDVQTNSSLRRTWFWFDEARLAGRLLSGEMIPYLAVKGRSRGACLVLAFQDMEGFKEAAGERVANEIIAQCSTKAFLRLASEGSTSWASRELGKYETLESFVSDSRSGGKSVSDQRVEKTVVLPSEFYGLPVTSKKNGLTGYFISPERGVWKGTVSGPELQTVVVSEEAEALAQSTPRPEADQWLRSWTKGDRERLGLEKEEPALTKEQKKELRVAKVNFERFANGIKTSRKNGNRVEQDF